jgi:hypothetical protein
VSKNTKDSQKSKPAKESKGTHFFQHWEDVFIEQATGSFPAAVRFVTGIQEGREGRRENRKEGE